MTKANLTKYYNAVAAKYDEQYNLKNLEDASKDYPANFFRLQELLRYFADRKKIIEVGVGEGTPLLALAKMGADTYGFDVSSQMVRLAKQKFAQNNFDPNKIFIADIEKKATFKNKLVRGSFDGLIAMGVMPHITNEQLTLKNMASLLSTGGKIFIEFRNKLFSLFTFNRHTLDFILNDLLAGVDDKLKQAVIKELKPRLRMNMPREQMTLKNSNAPGYDAVLAKFHNPFLIKEIMSNYGFGDIEFFWYHFHPAMPSLDKSYADIFRKEAIRLEGVSDWRGFFLCSAFVVKAIKK